jgi:hypothetical protein
LGTGNVLYISGEDDPEDTLVPRMHACKADLSRIRFLTSKSLTFFTLAHLEMLDRAMKEMEGAALVVIDPPTAYLAGTDDHKNADLRQLLTPLQAWASANNCAIIFNTHLNKGGAGKVDAAARVMGSVAWVNGVRAAHIFAKDPDDPLTRLFVPLKNNLGPEQKGLTYKIQPINLGDELIRNDQARVEWGTLEIDTTADAAVASTKKEKPSSIQSAMEWLAELFSRVRSMASEEITEKAKADRIGRNAVFDAKKAIGIKAKPFIDADGKKQWIWEAPPNWPKPASPTEIPPEFLEPDPA